MDNILVSIITPSYNGAQYIEQCIKTVMNQSYKNIEHIIVDGGSTDNTIEILKRYEGKYNMKWISEADNGMYDAINKGFAMCSGNILAWLNTDDMYMPWAIELIVQIMTEKSIHWVTGLPGNFNGQGIFYFPKQRRVPAYGRKAIASGRHHGRGLGFIQQESTFWSRDLWEKVGGIDLKLKYAGDFYLWKEFAQYEELYTVDTVLAGFRYHGNQKTANINSYFEEIKTYCTVLNLSLWGLNKLINFNYIYYYLNKKNIINTKNIFGYNNKGAENLVDENLEWIKRFVIKKGI